MRLRKIRIRGFQSFADSGEVTFEDGFNLIIGQNNSGKSSLLRAMIAGIADDRHRTPELWEEYKLPRPEALLTLEANGDELIDAILRTGGTTLFPLPHTVTSGFQEVVQDFLRQPAIPLIVSSVPNVQFTSAYPGHGLFTYEENNARFAAQLTPVDGVVQIAANRLQDGGDSIAHVAWESWTRKMFYFSAERMTIGSSAVSHATRLDPDARNLPAVLQSLYSERGDLFRKLVSHIGEIFQTVGNLSVRYTPQNLFEIRVWPTAAMERLELSFPLNASGTGVAQVIAILTAIMTIDNAVIIIDEINSFLHPAAVKALLRILQTEYPQHQYIISTHAPEVIGFSNARSVHLVRRAGYDSSIERLDLESMSEFRGVAEHLGVSMADVFAADRVVWVEGPTEELAFPYLYQQMGGEPLPRGVLMTSVTATGDFNRKRDRQIVFEVYRRLSSAAATLVVATHFSFDSETLSETDKEAILADAGGRLSFLPRRHLECYLVDAEAISAFILAQDPSVAEAASPEMVSAKLAMLAGSQDFLIPEWQGDITSDTWLSKVDAAKLIGRTVAELSEHRASFHKKEDSLKLMQAILARDAQLLRPLFDYIAGLVAAVSE